jgi:hypothetical protein
MACQRLWQEGCGPSSLEWGVASEIYVYQQVSLYVASRSKSERKVLLHPAALLAVNLVKQQYVVEWGCTTNRFPWDQRRPNYIYILTCMYEWELLRVLRVRSGTAVT